MRLLVLLSALLLVSCATTKKSDPLDKPQVQLTELKAPPAPLEDEVVPVDPGGLTAEQAACVRSLGLDPGGFVMSEQKLVSLSELRLYAEQTYSDGLANGAICTAHLDATWNQLKKADKLLDDIHERENSWWNRNKGTITFAAGFIVGAGSSILIVYGVSQATE